MAFISDKLKVLFYLFFPAGGIGKYTQQQLEELMNCSELDIEVACLPDFQWRNNDKYVTWPGLFGISHRWPLLRKLRFLLGQFINPRRLLRRARETGADIIHICNINYLSFPAWRRELDSWGGYLVCTAHDIRRQSPILNRRFEEKQLKAFYRRCDAVFVHSNEQAKELQNFADVKSERIHVVPHGPSVYAAPPSDDQAILKATYGMAPNKQVALFFGFLRPEKNLAGMIQALHKANCEELHLYVAGNVPPGSRHYLQECRELIAKCGLEDQVTLDVRYIPDCELPALLKLCDWVALPYQQSFTSQSGVLNLAAFYERPVLATPSASFRELLEAVAIGHICSGFEAPDIAEGIRSMTAYIAMGKEWDFKTYRAQCSWLVNTERTRRVYQQISGQAV